MFYKQRTNTVVEILLSSRASLVTDRDIEAEFKDFYLGLYTKRQSHGVNYQPLTIGTLLTPNKGQIWKDPSWTKKVGMGLWILVLINLLGPMVIVLNS